MYTENDLLPISALQHLAFCPRQCALIHVEQVWAENRQTAEGRLLHQRAHDTGTTWEGEVLVTRGLDLRCLRLGLVGKADVVEFHPTINAQDLDADAAEGAGLVLPGRKGRWRAHPVEYKRGKRKLEDVDRVQLCAQALCLEEMLKGAVPQGSLFYGKTRRREEVLFTPALRAETERIAMELHTLIAAGKTPPAEYSPRCESCSLIEVCLPQAAGLRQGHSASRYLAKALNELMP
ncbi:MAG: CRISPR-associated protein Cas4 [Deltaproteobacteria bacterium]|nr:CRISPR-associated protein Cas4 [Deltaproteobacteria bacterium]